MSFLFNRYTPHSRRAIFFAREAALHAGSNEINSMHMLSGLLVESASRANLLFKLQDQFPDETTRMRAMQKHADQRDIPLAQEGKRILRCARDEADLHNQYWIDTGYLAVGILRMGASAASAELISKGMSVRACSELIGASSENPEAGPVPLYWTLSKPLTRTGRWAGLAYVFGVLLLIRILTERSC